MYLVQCEREQAEDVVYWRLMGRLRALRVLPFISCVVTGWRFTSLIRTEYSSASRLCFIHLILFLYSLLSNETIFFVARHNPLNVGVEGKATQQQSKEFCITLSFKWRELFTHSTGEIWEGMWQCSSNTKMNTTVQHVSLTSSCLRL